MATFNSKLLVSQRVYPLLPHDYPKIIPLLWKLSILIHPIISHYELQDGAPKIAKLPYFFGFLVFLGVIMVEKPTNFYLGGPIL